MKGSCQSSKFPITSELFTLRKAGLCSLGSVLIQINSQQGWNFGIELAVVAKGNNLIFPDPQGRS